MTDAEASHRGAAIAPRTQRQAKLRPRADLWYPRARVKQHKDAAPLIPPGRVCAPFAPWLTRITDEALSAIRTQLDEAAFAVAWEQGRTLTADEAVALALESLD